MSMRASPPNIWSEARRGRPWEVLGDGGSESYSMLAGTDMLVPIERPESDSSEESSSPDEYPQRSWLSSSSVSRACSEPASERLLRLEYRPTDPEER